MAAAARRAPVSRGPEARPASDHGCKEKGAGRKFRPSPLSRAAFWNGVRKFFPDPRSRLLAHVVKHSSLWSFGTVVCATAIVFAMLPVAAPAQSTAYVIREVKHDVSPPLRELEQLTPAQPNPFSLRVLNVLPTGPAPLLSRYAVIDTALQVQALGPVTATVG
jgi:hypothetical protein